MAYCRNCGKQIDDGVSYCPSCGSSQRYSNSSNNYDPSQIQSYQSQQQYQYQRPPNYDSGSAGWLILGFLVPLVGLILWIVWSDDKPKSAKMAGVGALLSILFSVILTIIIVAALLAMPDTATSSIF